MVDRNGLESRVTCKRTVGSNPYPLRHFSWNEAVSGISAAGIVPIRQEAWLRIAGDKGLLAAHIRTHSRRVAESYGEPWERGRSI